MASTIKAADLFCGAGGASTGLLRAARAFGLEVDLLAVNHWPVAVETHTLNHPGVRHMCESVERIDPRKAVPGGRLHLLLAGPECTHHSVARGGRPIHDQSRATAWHILKWAQELYIDNILIENVPEFRSWGPLGANGRPLKSKKGETYRAFLETLRSLGYDRVEDRVVCAADYGDPTTRQRLFILAQRGQKRVAYPRPTHSRTGGETLFGKTKRWRAAREVIDWGLQGQSIFDRKKPLAPATMARILAGLEKFGGKELEPFLVILRRHAAGRSLKRPLPTISAQGQHIALAQPFLVPVNHGEDSGHRPRSVEEPLPTLTARANQYLVEPFLVANNANNVPKSADEPLATVTGGNRHYLVEPLVEPFLVPMYGEREGQDPRTHSVDEPVPTIPASGGGKFGVVEPFIITPGGANLRQPRSVDEPLPTITGSDRFAVAEPFVVAVAHGDNPPWSGRGNGGRVRSVDDPLPTVSATGQDYGVVEPFLVQTSERRAERVDSVDEPVRTITAAAGRCFGLAQPFLTKYNGTAKTRAYSVEDPLDTISTRDRFGLVQPCIDGYVLDIRFRMLQPHELAAATSFPKDYKFCGKKEEVVKQIGNAWPGETSRAFCLEILAPYAGRGHGRRRKERVA